MMKIEHTAIGPFGTNCYLVTEEGRSDCVVVDAPPGAERVVLPVLKSRGLNLTAILITHGHWDHNAGVAALLDGVAGMQAELPQVFAHADGRECHETPEKYKAWYQSAIPELGDEDFRAFKVSHWTEDGEAFPLLGKTWTALYVPGHCPGSLVFYCEDEKVAFTGDAIFAGSIGRTDLPGGSFSVLERAIREKIFTLPESVKLLPGHGPATEVGEEKVTNPFVRPI